MIILIYFFAFALGTIVGSFLNVVIYRLHTGKSFNGRSHCLSCGKQLRWYELLPLVSYIVLRGRCRDCSSYIPVRYFFVEFLTGLTFMLVWYFFQTDTVLLILETLLSLLLIVIMVYDVRHTIIPDEVTMGVGVIAILYLLYQFFLQGSGWSQMLGSIAGGVGAGLFFGGLWYISKGRWLGLGDAKLALPLGIIAGSSGVFSMVVLSFWIGAAISLLILFAERVPQYYRGLRYASGGIEKYNGYLTMKSEIPFAPFLIAGFLLVHLFHADIFDIILWFFPFL